MAAEEMRFEDWWAAFMADARERKDAYDTVDGLLRYADRLPTMKRGAFVAELVDLACNRSLGWSIALEGLSQLADANARRRLASALEGVPALHPPHPLGDYRFALLRVLASDPLGEWLEPVRAYCADKIGFGYTSVVWSLWPHQRDLFSSAYARYFAEQASESWEHTTVVQAFTTTPEALAAIRDVLLRQNRTAWEVVKKAVLSVSAASWVSWRQAERIRRVCEGGAA